MLVQFNISYEIQLTHSRQFGYENQSLQTDEYHLLHSLVSIFSLTG